MAIFTELPFETVVDILSLLSSSDLRSTTRVSSRLHRASQPLLYRTPCLPMITSIAARGSTRPSLELFLRTLLSPGYEKFGSHVRSLTVHLEPDGTTTGPSNYTTDMHERINTIATRLHIQTPIASPGGQFIVLLDLLPRLQVLHLSPATHHRSFTQTLQTTRAAKKLPRGLRSLLDVHLAPATCGANMDFCPLVMLMRLPSIRSLDVPSIDHYFRLPKAELKPAFGTSRATRLYFSHAEMTSGVLGQILKIPIALTHLSMVVEFEGYYNLEFFIPALAPLQKSLQYLHIDFRDVRPGPEDEYVEPLLPYPEGSLREWVQLRTLRCSLMVLLGEGPLEGSPRLVDVLPVGLRELEILPDCFWSAGQAADEAVAMLAEKESAVPGLQRVAVEMEMEGGRSAVVVQRLVEACEVAGVSFVEESFGW